MWTLQWLYSKEEAWSIKSRIWPDPTSDCRLRLFLPRHELFNNHCIIQGLPLWLSWWRIWLQCWRPGFNNPIDSQWHIVCQVDTRSKELAMKGTQRVLCSPVCSRTHITLQQFKVQIKSGAFLLYLLIYQIMCFIC